MARPRSVLLVAVFVLGGCHILLPLSANEKTLVDGPDRLDRDGDTDAPVADGRDGSDQAIVDRGPQLDLAALDKGPQPPPPGSCVWSRSFGSTDTAVGVSVATGAGLVCTAGYFKGTADFGKGSVTGKGIFDVFVVCTDALGQVKWAKTFGTSGTEAYARAVTVDAAGNVFITGFFLGSLDFGGASLASSNGSWDIFTAGFGPTGNHLWSKRFGAKKADWGYGAAVDGQGGLWLTGHFADQVSFGGSPLAAQNSTNIYVVKLATQTGAHLFSDAFGAQINDRGFWAAAGPGGGVHVTGYFTKEIDFGGGLISSKTPAKLDALLVSLNAGGGHLWSKGLGGIDEDRGEGLAVDSSGNVYATGRFMDKVDFGGGALVSVDSFDVFLASYDKSGNYRWSHRLGGPLYDGGRSVAVGKNGNVFATGYFAGTATFTGGSLTSKGDRDVFVASFDSAGKHRWSRSFGAAGEDEGHGVTADPAGVFVAGKFRSIVDFGCATGPLTSKGGDDVFLVRLAP
jgi:hypothetical protein